MYEITAQWRLEGSPESQALASICDGLLLASRDKHEHERITLKFQNPKPKLFEIVCRAMGRHVLKTQNGHHYTIFPVAGEWEWYDDTNDGVKEISFFIPYWITRNFEERPSLDFPRLKRMNRVRKQAQDFLEQSAKGITGSQQVTKPTGQKMGEDFKALVRINQPSALKDE